VEGLEKTGWAKALGLAGLGVMAGGGLFYAVSFRYGQWGLVACGVGLAAVLVALALARRQVGRVMGSRAARLGMGAGLATLAALALAVFLGALASRHHLRWDVSQARRHSLAPQTLKVLKKIDKPVEAIAFFRENQAGRHQAIDLLDQYHYRNRLFRYRLVDPDQQPGLAKRFEIKTYGSVVLVAGDKEEKVKYLDEQGLTNGLIRLLREGTKTIYFLTGHGERSIKDIGREGFSQLAKEVEKQNYRVKELLLATQKEVPADASVVIIAAPSKPLLPQEKQRLTAFLKRGGGLLIMLEPEKNAGLKDWLARRGIVVGEDMVLDKASRLFGASSAWPLAASYGQHQITDPLEGTFCFFPLCRQVRLADRLPKGVDGVELVKSSPASWAETDLAALKTTGATYEKGKDTRGPISLGVAVTITYPPPKGSKGPKPKGHLVVFGDADFANNSYLGQAGNQDLVLNAISYLAEEEDLVSIRPRQVANQPLLLQPFQARVVFWLPVVVLPLIFGVIGVVVILRRRRPA
jgi:ABC-type uncharacterized transport system involved in gliding motility auxiliary subunit